MSQKNHEETIRTAYVHSLVASGIPEAEAEKTAGGARYRNRFKAAEADAYREETGHDGAVPIDELAEYVAKKYPPGLWPNAYSVTEQGDIVAEEKTLVYTLADFKSEALDCKNQYHLTNWAEKHKNRIKKHLANEEEIAELRRFVSARLAELRGDPPVPEDPPQVVGATDEEPVTCDEEPVDDGPTTWQLAVEFDALCTEEQIKEIAGAVSKVLRTSPFVVEGSCKLVTR